MTRRQEATEHRIVYVSRVSYPDPAANALQTLHTATSLVAPDWRVELFVHDFPRNRQEFWARLAAPTSDIAVRSLHVSRWPAALRRSRYLVAVYNSLIAARLAATNRAPRVRSVLLVRSRLEVTYWGLMRRRFPWLRNWLLACEIHDVPERAPRVEDKPRLARLFKAFDGFDLAIAVNEGVGKDFRSATHDRLQVEVLPLGSGLARVKTPDPVNLSAGGIRMGYAGTVDQQHGVADLVRALAKLPDSWTLTLVGRSTNDYERHILELAADLGVLNRLERVGPVPYADMPSVLSGFAICLAPAGDNRHRQHYVSPLKIFDYMAMGKPIVAGARQESGSLRVSLFLRMNPNVVIR